MTYSYYICGTISDRVGFEYVELGPHQLPGSPSSYLDNKPIKLVKESHGFRQLEIDQAGYVCYSRYREINPNDNETNRGAYVSVGVVVSTRLNEKEAAKHIDVVSQIFGGICVFLGKDNAFPQNFRLKEFASKWEKVSIQPKFQISARLLTDIFRKITIGECTLHDHRGISFANSESDGTLKETLQILGYNSTDNRLHDHDEKERLARMAKGMLDSINSLQANLDEWSRFFVQLKKGAALVSKSENQVRDVAQELDVFAHSLKRISPAKQESVQRNNQPSQMDLMPEGAYSFNNSQGTTRTAPNFQSRTSSRRHHARGRQGDYSGNRSRWKLIAFGLTAFVVALLVVALAIVMLRGGSSYPNKEGLEDIDTQSRLLEKNTPDDKAGSVTRERAALIPSTDE